MYQLIYKNKGIDYSVKYYFESNISNKKYEKPEIIIDDFYNILNYQTIEDIPDEVYNYINNNHDDDNLIDEDYE